MQSQGSVCSSQGLPCSVPIDFQSVTVLQLGVWSGLVRHGYPSTLMGNPRPRELSHSSSPAPSLSITEVIIHQTSPSATLHLESTVVLSPAPAPPALPGPVPLWPRTAQDLSPRLLPQPVCLPRRRWKELCAVIDPGDSRAALGLGHSCSLRCLH